MNQRLAAHIRHTIYGLNLLLSISVALTSFYNTPLLTERGIPQEMIGVVYALASILGAIMLFFVPKILNRLGNNISFAIFALVNALAFIGLAISGSSTSILSLFVIMMVSSVLVYFLLDMFLESATVMEGSTGETRATFITMANVAWVMAPASAGLLISIGSFTYLYLVAGLLFIPIIGIAAYITRKIPKRTYEALSYKRMLRTFKRSSSMRNVFVAQFLLRFFYALMVIYTPLYLIKNIGLVASEMGIILSIAMFAFLLFEWPIGKLSDKYFGEKEMMVLGFIIIGFSTASLSFVTSASILVWGVLLFITRVGASFIEITSESYFFKHVDGDDTDDVGAFRMLSPAAYTMGPLMGSVFLFIFPVSWIFLFLGIIMLCGTVFALRIKDTK